MEPPSAQLGTLLAQLGLASSRDLRRCRPIVRRLARDLPTFDSVWVDALTQIRVLTPYQARVLESDRPDRLGVGPCVLVDELERDGRWTLCVARHRGSRRRCLLTYFNIASEDQRARESVRELIAKLRGVSHPSIVVPQGCDQTHGRLIVVSPYATGPTLRQLLIRRGRFPIPVVWEIARQLLDGLAALERVDAPHGDLQLNTIRLTSRGQSILLNPGVLPAIGTRVSFHDPLSADSYDGIAPELISTGGTATQRSDLYALGCLLWHLLAGRPPFPTGDPLSKLAAHQSRAIDDVRRWRPDVTAELSTLIASLTNRDPAARPSGPREVRETLRLRSPGGRARLSSFHASFGAVAPRHGDTHRSAARFPWTAAAILLLLLSGISVSLLDAGARNELLRLASRVREGSLEQARPVNSADAAPRMQVQQLLPASSADGGIELAHGQTYRARDIQTDRPLTIRCQSGTATIAVGADPLRISAQSLHLSGIRFTVDEPAVDTDSSSRNKSRVLLAIQAQQIALDRCQFDANGLVETATAIAWKVPDEADPTGGRFVARHSTILGAARALDLHAMPRLIGFDNCLKRGTGPLIRLNSPNHTAPLRIQIRQTTLRDAGPVVQWSPASAVDGIQPALIVVENSVVAMSDPTLGLLDFAGQAPNGWERMLQITGEGSLLHPGTSLVSAQSTNIDASGLRVEGLIIDDFEFAGDTPSTESSAVVSTQAPRSTATPPGIDPGQMTDVAERPVVRQASHEYNTR